MTGGAIPLRCVCARHPVLAMCGRDENGLVFVHLKVVKSAGHGQKRSAEMIATTPAIVKIRCRECGIWHTVRIQREAVSMTEPIPKEVLVSNG